MLIMTNSVDAEGPHDVLC